MDTTVRTFRPLFCIASRGVGRLNIELKKLGFDKIEGNWRYIVVALEEDEVISVKVVLIPENADTYSETITYKKGDKEHILQMVRSPQAAISSERRAILVFDGNKMTEKEFLDYYGEWTKLQN